MVASAYIITVLLVRADGKSFTKILKRSGPRMDPFVGCLHTHLSIQTTCES